jgi:hypothetical protein
MVFMSLLLSSQAKVSALNVKENLAGAHTKTLSSHELALLADTVFARISILSAAGAGGCLSCTYALDEDTVFARINLLAVYNDKFILSV